MNYNDELANQIKWKKLLTENYKKLGLSEYEFVTILLCDYYFENGQKAITPKAISLLSNFDENKAGSLLGSLLNKGLILIENSDTFSMNLGGIKRILIKEFLEQNTNQVLMEKREKISALISYFETELKSNLTVLEVKLISKWIDEGIEEEQIKNAYYESKAIGKVTFPEIENILYKRQEEIDRKNNGWSINIAEKVTDFENLIKNKNEKNK